MIPRILLVLLPLCTYASANSFQKYLQRENRGSQKEEPSLEILNGTITVRGYQKFSISENGAITYEGPKYFYIVELLKGLKNISDCNTFADIGGNTGLVSFLACSDTVGFKHALLLDHDMPCLNIAKAVSAVTHTNISAQRFDFGDPIPVVDVLFCGAIIHWIFCLTADFKGNFDMIMQYLSRSTKKYVVIEWVDKNDGAMRRFDHIGKCRSIRNTETYNREDFEKALYSIGSIKYSKSFGQRTIYTVERKY